MKTIKFKISHLNNSFMERMLLVKLGALDDIYDIALNRKTQELSIAPKNFRPMTDDYIDRACTWRIGDPAMLS